MSKVPSRRKYKTTWDLGPWTLDYLLNRKLYDLHRRPSLLGIVSKHLKNNGVALLKCSRSREKSLRIGYTYTIDPLDQIPRTQSADAIPRLYLSDKAVGADLFNESSFLALEFISCRKRRSEITYR